MSDPIKDAIIAAGQELSRQHAWRLDHDDDKDADQTLFFRVVYRHVFRAAMPEHIRAARIAELEAELSTMEQCGRTVADVVQQSAERIAELEADLATERQARGLVAARAEQLHARAEAAGSRAAKLEAALRKIEAMEHTEENEWDAVERLIPEMCEIARDVLRGAP